MPKKQPDRYKPRKDGRYYTTVGTGKYNERGIEVRIPLYAKTSAELEQKVAEARYLVKTGKYIAPDRITVSKYAEDWLELRKSKKGINTKAMYENVVFKHIRPSIGPLRLQDLTPRDCQLMINDRWEHYETCNKIRLTMRQIQKAAIAEDIITKPFWTDIEMPKKPPSEKRPLTEIEKKAIIAAEFDQQERVFVYLLFGCGIRREEAIALHVSDFDLDKHDVSIHSKIVFEINRPVWEDTTKTEHGVRTLHIPKSVFPTINLYVRRLVDKKVDKLLFTLGNGDMITKSSYDKMWGRIIKKMNYAMLPEKRRAEIEEEAAANRRLSKYNLMLKSDLSITGLTAHIFRHNYATLLYYSGISELKAVELMGHADGKMIREVYAHLDDKKEDASNKLDAEIAL